ncbi:MAG: isoprenylcysteine carboxylmethyltransferase family protein [Candidatus Lokiarchaeota archaeon]|nr:isoprenylcysteine carboxylmethyltransferase family protein [Candidatus Lokiarchaeota archaeon]
MEIEEFSHSEREHPHGHLIQALLPILFVVVWILDGIALQWTTWLNDYVPLALRIVLFAATLLLAFALMNISHKQLFKHDTPSNKLITSGILKRVRNPLYLGVLLIYVAFVFLSMSLICVVFFVVVFAIYNKLVNHEEKVLEKIFGKEWLKYKSTTPKWLPNPFK